MRSDNLNQIHLNFNLRHSIFADFIFDTPRADTTKNTGEDFIQLISSSQQCMIDR